MERHYKDERKTYRDRNINRDRNISIKWIIDIQLYLHPYVYTKCLILM